MKKIATITFHASYNFGSCLQAFALQEYVKKLHNGDCLYEIINLRTEKQKSMYMSPFDMNGLSNYVKRLIFLFDKNKLKRREEKFESFLSEKLQLTKEYNSANELMSENFEYDYYIAGSDQLWNLDAPDFEWANFLEFTDSENKISYAASFGPSAQNLSDENKDRIKQDLLKFKNLSVRENGSYECVKSVSEQESTINMDPTMLLNYDEWNKIIPSERLIRKKYILLYNLKGDAQIKLAKKIAKKLGLKIVVATPRFYDKMYNLKTYYDCGPCEFLNLIKNAELVLSSSFHGTIFSIILRKPFFSLYGKNDMRITTLLKRMNLEDRNIDDFDYEDKAKNAFDVDFAESLNLIKDEVEKSKKYLCDSLDI